MYPSFQLVASLCLRCIHKLEMHKKQRRNEETMYQSTYDKENCTRGSLTVEAALVLPVFFFAVLTFLYFFQILEIQAYIQTGLFKTAGAASEFAYPYQGLKQTEQKNGMQPLAASLYYKMEFQKHVDAERLDNTCIEGGCNGIQFTGSRFLEEEEEIRITASYHIRLPVPFFHLRTLEVKQSCLSRGFVGVGTEDEKKYAESGKTDSSSYVFITETGTAYHESRECTHIQLRIRSVKTGDLEELRNEGGGKYKRCHLCLPASAELSGQCYITTDGDRYHRSISCSGLKRTVMKIPREEAGSRTPCTRCG